jgi:hypothetical protein
VGFCLVKGAGLGRWGGLGVEATTPTRAASVARASHTHRQLDGFQNARRKAHRDSRTPFHRESHPSRLTLFELKQGTFAVPAVNLLSRVRDIIMQSKLATSGPICSKCGGPMRRANAIAGLSQLADVIYECCKCGHVELIDRAPNEITA